ncbi:peptidoglycan DD-metalloendopeptidase family protein [Exiguobacterium sp. S22-S28]|uniref:peptidoglycan DD-metalloendopeptidase family protein n=1 Tax=Exiguobacterium sp. S22-S28 TaxID=3342768 RepID=UPI00372D2B4F
MKRILTTVTMSALVVSGFASTGTGKVEAASSSSYKVKIMADGLRVRTGPSTKYRIVAGVNAGQTFKYQGKTGNWTKISYGGKKRYVYSGYVKRYSTSKKATAKKASFSTGFLRPTNGPVTQGYGSASGRYGYTFHNGIDIAAATGTTVRATASGKVIQSGYQGAYGNYVMMTHKVNGLTYTSVYAHLSSRSVYAGQSIAKGTKIGNVGSTGNSTGSHLHFELHRGGYVYSGSSAANSINPLNVL